MWPTFGSLRAYTVLYAAALLTHYWVSWRIARRDALGWRVWVTVSVLFSVGSIVGGKVLYDLQQPAMDWGALVHPAHYVHGGYWGGLLAYLGLAIPAALLLGQHQHRRAALDLVALSIPVPFILAKLGCLLNGCCYGRACSLPWAIVFPAGSRGAPAGVPVHPTQIYEMAAMLAVLLAFRWVDRDRWRGTRLLWFLAIYGAGRALIETFRGDVERHLWMDRLTLSQPVCLGVALLSVGLLVWWRRSSPGHRPG